MTPVMAVLEPRSALRETQRTNLKLISTIEPAQLISKHYISSGKYTSDVKQQDSVHSLISSTLFIHFNRQCEQF